MAEFHEGVARALPMRKGAIICSTFERVQMAFDWETRHIEETLQDAQSRGYSKLLRETTPQPNHVGLGCVLVPGGVRVQVRYVNFIPIVRTGVGGGVYEGVTLPAMVELTEKMPQ
jgi:hypothetical protein